MKKFILNILFCSLLLSCGQKKEMVYKNKEAIDSSTVPDNNMVNPLCGCKEDPYLSDQIDCDTSVLKSGGLLYWHYNCDSSWLTLEDKTNKIVLNSLDGIHAYTYRIGYQLEKEFEKSLLFRHGCPANGPCGHSLIDKTNGSLIKDYNKELIYNGEDSLSDFIVYFTNATYNSISIEFVNQNKIKKIPFPANRMNAYGDVVPEFNFNDIRFENDILYLPYQYKMKEKAEWKYDSLIININKLR